MADTTTKRIKLEVQSGNPNLQGLNATTAALGRLAGQLRTVVGLSATFSRQTGFDLSGIGKGASSAVAAISQVANAAKSAQAAIDGLNKKAYSTSKSFASPEHYKANDPYRTTSEYRSPGRRTRFVTDAEGNTQIHDLENAAKLRENLEKSNEKARQRQAAQALRMGSIRTPEEQSIRDREAQSIRRQRAEERAEAAKQSGIDQAARSNRAAAIRRERAEERESRRFQSAYTGQQLAYKTELAGIGPAAGKASSLTGGIYAAQADAARKQIAIMTTLRDSVRMYTAEWHKANAAINSATVNLTKAMAGGSPGGTPGSRWLNTGLKGWTPSGFLKNTLTATGWLAAVQVPMKAIQLAGHSYERMEQIQLQEARLTQVFRGVGGSARELSDDVLKLAAAEGRGTEEATLSAVAWSRLGLSRRQAAEATKQSLIGANVAEMTADETTQKLTATMAAYNLQVSELGGVLGTLNQLSNTYRVTNKDLFEGLSRVSGIAQQAGMSLESLSGLLAVSVQKTGQTGANMSNAMKTTLVRLNRDDVKEFFSKRYNTDVDGTAESLQKVHQIYERVNADERLDIMLKVGSATQANRFRAIMESYNEGILAGADALKHLNSAEQENLLITNTAAAARARLGSTWDRFVNSPAVSGFVAGQLNDVSSIISGFTKGPNGQKPAEKYFDASQTSKGGAFAGFANKLNFGGVRSTFIKTAMDTNYLKDGGMTRKEAEEAWDETQGIFTTPQTAGDKFQENMKDVLAMEGQSKASAARESIFKNMAGNWANMSASDKSKNLDILGGSVGGMTPDNLAKIKAGNISGLTDQAAIEHKLYVDAKAAALAQTQFLIDRNAEDQKSTTKQSEIDELIKQEGELKKVSNEQWKEWNDELTDGETKMNRLNRLMIEHKGLMADIAGSVKGIGLSNYFDETVGLKGQIGAAQRQHDALKGPENMDAATKLHGEILAMQARLGYLQSPGALSYAKSESDRGIAGSYYNAEIGSKGVGLSEGEKMLDKQKWLRSEISKMASPEKANDNDRLRNIQLIAANTATELQISERILKVKQDIKQVQIESNREFQKSLITAGPGDILRKLALNQLNRGGRQSAGSFFAMSGDMRSDAYNLIGGDAMARLRAEDAALRGHGGSVTGMQGAAWKGAQSAAKYGEAYAGSVAAAAIQANMDGAAKAASTILGYFNQMAGIMSGMVANSGRAPQVASAPSATPVPQAEPSYSNERGYYPKSYVSGHDAGMHDAGAPDLTPVPNTSGATVMDFSK